MRIIDFILALILALSWSAVGMTASEGSAESTYKVVTSEELKAMLDSKVPGLMVIDARFPEEYQKAHIKDAVNIPLEILEKNAAMLGVPKDAKLVFYCNGITCGKSKKSAVIALEQGYKDVSVYADGMPVWEEKGYPLD